MEKVDYGKTLNLPQTEFPMRGNLPKKEPEMIEFWDSNDIYGKVAAKNEGNPKYILHDGPPYANGLIILLVFRTFVLCYLFLIICPANVASTAMLSPTNP